MKTYRVTVEYGGRAEAIVKAETEDEALSDGEQEAMQNIGIDPANTNIRSVSAEEIE